MQYLTKPPFPARQIFEACANNIEDEGLAARLRSVSSLISSVENQYDLLGSSATLFLLKETSSVGGSVSTAEMEALYKGTFSRKGSKLRVFYDWLRASAPNQICPLCGQRVVKTLDHYLAKSKHPSLAVMPLNLIPACSDCNKLKLARQPKDQGDQTFHPYFDNLEDEIWLEASIEETTPPTIIFSAVAPTDWDPIKKQRLATHFSTYELGMLYGAQAGAELVSARYSYTDAVGARGSTGLKSDLQIEADSLTKAVPNYWRAALYRALAKSAWFCEIGYETIKETKSAETGISSTEDLLAELIKLSVEVLDE